MNKSNSIINSLKETSTPNIVEPINLIEMNTSKSRLLKERQLLISNDFLPDDDLILEIDKQLEILNEKSNEIEKSKNSFQISSKNSRI